METIQCRCKRKIPSLCNNNLNCYTPATKLGIYWKCPVCLSVDAWLRKMFQSLPRIAAFPLQPSIIMKLHTQTPHESKMCPINYGVKRSRSHCIDCWKRCMLYNCFPFRHIIIKNFKQTSHTDSLWVDNFWVKRSTVTMHWLLKNCNWRIIAFSLHV